MKNFFYNSGVKALSFILLVIFLIVFFTNSIFYYFSNTPALSYINSNEYETSEEFIMAIEQVPIQESLDYYKSILEHDLSPYDWDENDILSDYSPYKDYGANTKRPWVNIDIYFEIFSDGDVVITNYNNEQTDSEYKTTIELSNLYESRMVELSEKYINEEEFKNGFVVGDIVTGVYQEEFIVVDEDTLEVISSPNLSAKYEIVFHYNKDDVLSWWGAGYTGIYLEIANLLFITKDYNLIYIIISAILSFILLIHLFLTTGKKDKETPVHLSQIDKIPLEILLIIYSCIIALPTMYAVVFAWSVELLMLAASSIIVISLLVLLSCITRLKAGKWYRNTITYMLIKFFTAPVRYAYNILVLGVLKTNFVLKSILFCTAILLLIILTANLGTAFFLSMVLCAVILVFSIYIAYLKKSTEKIAKGDYSYKTEDRYLLLDFKEFAQNLNEISEGLDSAIAQKIKSERLKAELITNVSHDIKTPLTSIINYTDLLKQEKIENENAKEYIEVLDRQSQKLKRLVDDIMDASKISSGNISVEYEEIDLAVIITQIEGEYQEKLEEKGLKLITKSIENPIVVIADSRHLNRIIDNLMVNVLKYSLENTRVYIDVLQNENTVTLSIKNTSKEPLNISSDELMQRFVRGDESRNTQGNGLGLSIAQSLAVSFDAQLNIIIDADLFKAELDFKPL